MKPVETVEQPTAAHRARPGGKVKPNNKLSAPEKTLFRKCETKIRHHFETFRPAGEALQTIRDKRLYRETHATFEDYCREKWEMSKTQANRLIAAARVVENLTTVAPASVTEHLTESVIRPLTNLSPEKQKQAFKQAVELAPSQRGLTAKIVNAAAHKVAPGSFKKSTVDNARRGSSDLIRRTELLDEINAWERKQRSEHKFERLKPVEVVRAIRTIIKGL